MEIQQNISEKILYCVDGMEQIGGRTDEIKDFLQCSSYFVDTYTEHELVNLYIYTKIVTKILVSIEIWCHGVGGVLPFSKL